MAVYGAFVKPEFRHNYDGSKDEFYDSQNERVTEFGSDVPDTVNSNFFI